MNALQLRVEVAKMFGEEFAKQFAANGLPMSSADGLLNHHPSY